VDVLNRLNSPVLGILQNPAHKGSAKNCWAAATVRDSSANQMRSNASKQRVQQQFKAEGTGFDRPRKIREKPMFRNKAVQNPVQLAQTR
jgi:hypothetical protein